MQLGVKQEGFDGFTGVGSWLSWEERCLSGHGSGVQKQDIYEYRE